MRKIRTVTPFQLPGEFGRHGLLIFSMSATDNGGHSKPFMRPIIIFGALEALGAVVGTIATDLAGYPKFFSHWIGLCCHVAGVFAVWHEATPEIETKSKLRRIWKVWFSTACAICFGIACLVWWPEPTPQGVKQADLRLALKIDGFTSSLELTNEFLRAKLGSDIRASPGVVLIPFTNATDLAVSFILRNHENPVTGLSVAFIMLETNFSWVFPASEWQQETVPLNDGLRGVAVSTSEILGAFTQVVLPPISFRPIIESGKSSSAPHLVQAQIRTKEIPITVLTFWICFTRNQKVAIPHVVLGENTGSNTIIFTFPRDRPFAPGPDYGGINIDG